MTLERIEKIVTKKLTYKSDEGRQDCLEIIHSLELTNHVFDWTEDSANRFFVLDFVVDSFDAEAELHFLLDAIGEDRA